MEFRLFDGPTDLWNFGFGDLREDDSWDDSSLSNNADLPKIMATVIQSAFLFLVYQPKARLVIRPLDRRRNVLYQAIFIRNWAQIDPIFTVLGVSEKGPKPFDPQVKYHAFIVFRKPSTFDKK